MIGDMSRSLSKESEARALTLEAPSLWWPHLTPQGSFLYLHQRWDLRKPGTRNRQKVALGSLPHLFRASPGSQVLAPMILPTS